MSLLRNILFENQEFVVSKNPHGSKYLAKEFLKEFTV